MGHHNADGGPEPGRQFIQRLLTDLRALEKMLEDGLIESGVRRIGAEQEMFLVDSSWRAAPLCDEVLGRINDPHFTPELARFNLEANLDPLPFGGDCLRRMENQTQQLVTQARGAAAEFGAQVLLTGILPSLHKSDLDLANMTPRPRYAALNEALTRLRGSAYEFRIAGVDELRFEHYSVMLEACNTSFQVHFQCDSEEFARLYNVAQAITAPVLAAAVNSPVLFGKRLWRETRIALFQQSVDTRSSGPHLRDIQPRVSFGTNWVKNSVMEIFQEDVARFKVLLAAEQEDNPFDLLARGEAPRLRALQLHNSTIYRWNRPCYGISEGKPHLRIESRFMPAGPSVVDQIANAALWFGLMSSFSDEQQEINSQLDFDDAKNNFIAAARTGLEAQFTWVKGAKYTAQELIIKEMLPRARAGLAARKIDAQDIDRYLGVMEERVKSGRTGAMWMIDSLAAMKGQGARGEVLTAVTAASVARQLEGKPVHEWELAQIHEAGGWLHNFARVEQYMSTDLFTVHDDEIVDLVASIMDWKRVRHVPVEDDKHRLVGLVSYRSLLRHLARGQATGDSGPVPVSALMEKSPICVTPETPTLDAIALMRKHRISCLPVVKDERLVGILTDTDFMDVARQLLEGFLLSNLKKSPEPAQAEKR